MAVNNPEMLETLFDGEGSTLSFKIIPDDGIYKGVYTPLAELPDDTRELFEYHPDKAKQLLAEAGYPDGFEFTLLNFFPWGLPVATIVQAQLAEVGITMNINNMEFGAGATQMLVDRKYDMSLNDWAGPGAPTPNAVMGEFYDPAMVGPWQWNMHNVNDPIMAFIVGELALQTDLAAAKGLSDAAQRKVIDEAWGTFLYYPNRLHASSSSVNGYDMHPHPWYGFVLSMDVLGVNVWIE